MARVLPASAICAYLAIVFLIGAPAGWRDLGVAGKSLSFFDLRSVTTAWECDRRGIDVLPRNPCDPEQRPANYPRMWLWPSRLGLGESATVPIGIVIAVLYFLTAIALAPRDGPLWRTAAFSAFLLMPGMMLGVERGNVDLLLFCLVALAVWLFSRPRGRTASAALILLAAILKLFPIFAAPLLLRQPLRRAAIAIASVAVAFGVYVLATWTTIHAIFKAVPKSGSLSYGLDILGHPAAKVTGIGGRFAWDAALAIAALGAAYVISRIVAGGGHSTPPSRFELDAFLTGTSVFLLTYVFFRNFDYRLVFLVLSLPLLLRRAEERRLDGWAALVALAGTLCFESRQVLPVGVIAQYALFVLLVAALLELTHEGLLRDYE